MPEVDGTGDYEAAYAEDLAVAAGDDVSVLDWSVVEVYESVRDAVVCYWDYPDW